AQEQDQREADVGVECAVDQRAGFTNGQNPFVFYGLGWAPNLRRTFDYPSVTGKPERGAYHHTDGRRAFVVKRTETSRGKQILPISVWQTRDGTRDWYAKALPGSRPLYRVADVLDNPGKTVLISEGEK
ncbi:hypothetical protein, partial [Phaeobacter sp. B1627]|uniref:hypothetical protein n=1 Tax=Phaeobacter sp. B1627 TaxID=2583809 RepID=UPI00159EF15F